MAGGEEAAAPGRDGSIRPAGQFFDGTAPHGTLLLRLGGFSNTRRPRTGGSQAKKTPFFSEGRRSRVEKATLQNGIAVL